jgi:hypothetical protein
MKKKSFLLLLIFLVGGLTVSSQTEKGKWFVSGLNILSFQAGTSKYTDDYGSSKSNISQFCYGPSFIYGSLNFVNSPTINYGIIDKLSIGLFMTVNLDSQKDENDTKSKNSVFDIGPSVRYYFIDNKKFLPFAEGKIGFGGSSEKYGSNDASKSGLFIWYLGTGGTYFFKPKVGMDFTLGYGNIGVKDKGSNSHNFESNASIVNIGIGMIIGF